MPSRCALAAAAAMAACCATETSHETRSSSSVSHQSEVASGPPFRLSIVPGDPPIVLLENRTGDPVLLQELFLHLHLRCRGRACAPVRQECVEAIGAQHTEKGLLMSPGASLQAYAIDGAGPSSGGASAEDVNASLLIVGLRANSPFRQTARWRGDLALTRRKTAAPCFRRVVPLPNEANEVHRFVDGSATPSM